MKEILRKMALENRESLTAPERSCKSEQITQHILQSENYKNAHRIFSFVSMGSEVETRKILYQAWKDGKTVAVPKSVKGRVMYFLPIKSLMQLVQSPFGVLEPIGDVKDALTPTEDDLFLIPGALFDKQKNRIGYGGGYYDSYLKKHKSILKIGLAFQMQITDTPLPVMDYDVTLDHIVTENGWQ